MAAGNNAPAAESENATPSGVQEQRRIKLLHLRGVLEEAKEGSVAVRDLRRDLPKRYRVQVVQSLGNGPFVSGDICLLRL